MLPLIFTKKFLFPLVAISVALFGCSDPMSDNTGIQTSGTLPTIPNEIQAVDGSLVPVSEFNGVPTAMWFWSPNWGQCRAEASAVAELKRTYQDNIQFIGIASRGDLTQVKEFIERYSVTGLPHVFDEQGDIWRQYKISSQPAWIFTDSNGNQERVIGALSDSEIRKKLEDLQKPNPVN